MQDTPQPQPVSQPATTSSPASLPTISTPPVVSAVPSSTPLPQQAGRLVEPPAVSGHREHGPISTVMTEFTQPEQIVQSPEPEIRQEPPEVSIPPELRKIVEKGPDAKTMELDQMTRQAGVELAKESVPTITTPGGVIQMPMTYTQAVQKKKTSRFRDSVHWLAAYLIYQWIKFDPEVAKQTKKHIWNRS